MARLYKCKKVKDGDGFALLSSDPNLRPDQAVFDVTTGHDLAGNEIEQHEWVAPPPPLRDKNPLPANPRKYQEFIEEKGQRKLL